MGDEKLEKWAFSSNPYIQLMVLFILEILAILGLVSLISGIGFTKEVEQYRILILIIAVLISVATAIFRMLRRKMSWGMYYTAVIRLRDKILESQELGGFRPHLVIGINQGGAIVGGILYYISNRCFHFSTIWLYDDWKVHSRQSQKDELIRKFNVLAESMESQPRILLVDDSFKTGSAMAKAMALVNESIENSVIKKLQPLLRTAAIVYRSDLRDEKKGSAPDYYIHQHYTHFPYSKV